jgi:hypothetical protein
MPNVSFVIRLANLLPQLVVGLPDGPECRPHHVRDLCAVSREPLGDPDLVLKACQRVHVRSFVARRWASK